MTDIEIVDFLLEEECVANSVTINKVEIIIAFTDKVRDRNWYEMIGMIFWK